MKPRSALLVYSLLFFLLAGPACSMANRLQTSTIDPTATRPRRFVQLPPTPLPANSTVQLTPYAPLASPAAPGVLEGLRAAPPAASELPGGAGTDPPFTYSNEAAPWPEAPALAAAPTIAPPEPQASLAPPPESREKISAVPQPVRRPTPTPEPEGLLGAFSELMELVAAAEVTAAPTYHLITLPSPSATPTLTPTATPTDTPVPTDTPIPSPTLPPTSTPLPTPTPGPTNTPYPTPVPAPTEPPLPTPTPVPDYDFMLAEFLNSATRLLKSLPLHK